MTCIESASKHVLGQFEWLYWANLRGLLCHSLHSLLEFQTVSEWTPKCCSVSVSLVSFRLMIYVCYQAVIDRIGWSVFSVDRLARNLNSLIEQSWFCHYLIVKGVV